MARIRSYKPEFFTDSKTGTLSGDAVRLLFGLWAHADDDGVIELDPWEIKIRILPFATGDPVDLVIDPLEREIVPRGLAVPFLVDGRPFLWFPRFRKHQKIDRPGKPVLDGWKRDEMTAKTYPGAEVIGAEDLRRLEWSTPGTKPTFRRAFDEHSTSVRRSFDDDEHSTSVRRAFDERSTRKEGRKEGSFGRKETHHARACARVEQDETGGEVPGDGERLDSKAAFDQFWQAYPRKVARVAAWNAWQSILFRKGRDPVDLLPVILAAIEKQKRTEQWQRGVIPNPANWLEDCRWEDVTEIDEEEQDAEETARRLEELKRQVMEGMGAT